jgi:DNA-binding transcriptional ArsR family regulator
VLELINHLIQVGGNDVGGTKARRSIDEAVRFANAHSLRTSILCLLNEHAYTAKELSRLVHESQSKVAHHIEELLNSGSIEVAETRQVKNYTQNVYRAIRIPFFSDEEMETLSFEERQEIYGLIIQAATAEAMASFSAGKISNDPRAWMVWDWFNVDRQGRQDIADELARSWERITEIEAESNARRITSDEPAASMIVTSFNFERMRPADGPGAHIGGS